MFGITFGMILSIGVVGIFLRFIGIILGMTPFMFGVVGDIRHIIIIGVGGIGIMFRGQ
jgi:hypothetical protein